MFYLKVQEFLKLFRIRLCFYTALTVLTGGMAVGVRGMGHLLLLFSIGCLYHIWGFALNDYCDRAVDTKSPVNVNRPLPRGTITARGALVSSGIALALYWVLIFVFFPSPGAILAGLAAPVSGVLYNIWGKKRPGMDVFLGLGLGCNCLLGGFSGQVRITSLALLTALIWGLEWFYLNMMNSLKDLEFDRRTGIRNTALVLGVFMKDGRYKMSPSFRCAVSSVRLVELAAAAYAFLLAPGRGEEAFFSLRTGLALLIFGGIVWNDLRLHIPKTFDQNLYFKQQDRGVILVVLWILFLLVPVSGYLVPLILIAGAGIWVGAFNLMIFGRLTVGFPWEKQI
jgi:4-hydroxybenzoate polyprenyltransferase